MNIVTSSHCCNILSEIKHLNLFDCVEHQLKPIDEVKE